MDTASAPTTTPAVEIVELPGEWAGDGDGDAGPEPLVEEAPESAAGSAGVEESECGSPSGSESTSLGEPPATLSNASSPSPPASPSFSPSIGPATAAAAATAPEEAAFTAAAAAPEADTQAAMPAVLTLNTIKSLEQLQALPVKQIKELLVRNRVDFRGCCERQELVERATQLWMENQESRRAFDQLGAAEMCKICMDAPIECVMLECGHMFTCMSCGKQMSECPLCKRYVVRVVRTFRA